MSLLDMPILRIELENIKHQTMRAMLMSNGELEQAISKAFDQWVATYPFEAAITRELERQADEILRESIYKRVRDYYAYGEGRALIDKALNDMVSNVALNTLAKTPLDTVVVNTFDESVTPRRVADAITQMAWKQKKETP